MRSSITLAAVLALGGLAAAPLVDAIPAATQPARDSGFFEVRFAAALTQVDRDLLATVGATAVTYVAPRGYRAYVDADGAALLREAPGVIDVTPVPAGAKLDGNVRGRTAAPLSVRVATQALGSVTEAAQLLGATVLGDLPVAEVAGATELIVIGSAAIAEHLVTLPQVAYVGLAPSALETEDEATAAVLARLATGPDAKLGPKPSYQPRYQAWLDDLGIDGTGVVVSVADTGVDEEHPNLNVVDGVDYSIAGEELDLGGHGTHVAGIIGGTGAGVPDALAVDKDGFKPGLGVAPGVGLLNQNIIGTTQRASHVALFERVVGDAIGLGANIWNASWTSGEGTNVGYTAGGARLDALVRDGSTDAGVQPFTMAFSAGNSGTGANGNGTLTSPKEAKNLIVVASVDSWVKHTVGPLGAGGDPRQVSSFSSRGPTRDGRIGVTVAAPGADIRSTKSFVGDSCNVPTGSEGGALYSFCSGTSMASPHAAGSAALITDWWRQREGVDPSPALIKALLVNSAVDIFVSDIPNIHEGWGRIDLAGLFQPAAGRIVRDGQDVLTDPGQVDSYSVEVDGTTPLKITLDWLDVPADPAVTAAIVNDLDLRVIAPDGTVYLGNAFKSGWSTTGGGADRLELLENVYVEKPAAGLWTVQVAAHALPADGALGRGDGTDQDYTLVVTGTR